MFSSENLMAELNTEFLGQDIICLPETNSTNKSAWEYIGKGCQEGTLLITDHQRDGRGRRQNKWVSTIGKSLTFSFILYPQTNLDQFGLLPLLTGVSIVKGIQSAVYIQAGLKWVVDLSKEHFIGKKCIEQEIKHPSRRLVCFKMFERSIPRKDYEVYLNDTLIGIVSSGTFSIGLNSGIGLAFIDAKYTKSKTIDIKIRNKFYRASLIKPPFINNYSLHS